jgi:hypothetical protein
MTARGALFRIGRPISDTAAPIAASPTYHRHTMTYLEAAEVVLKAARRSLTAGEITAIARGRGLIHPTGKTPEATISAALYMAKSNPDGPLQRRFRPGTTRAAHDSIKWV